jgi:hypothetical protein
MIRETFQWWGRIWRMAVRGQPPRAEADVPVWALCVPFRLWHRQYRFDGKVFHVAYGGKRMWWLPLRALYLGFLAFWPFVALLRSLHHPEKRRWYRNALARPDLAMLHPESDWTDREMQWMRPDYALSMLYAVEFARTRAEHFWLDDKTRFLERARNEGLPLPPTVTADEAIARGGEWVVKDPTRDLGYGVEIMDARELAKFEDKDELIVQERLRNHPDLLKAYPDDAPLSSLRVITLLDEETGKPRVLRCAVRMGRAGMPVDNTQQGGIWANLDAEGRFTAGVTKHDVGTWKDGKPVRHGVHPDSGRSFVGLKVPWFEEGRRMALDAHERLLPGVLTVGWDIALAATGPVFLELNVWTTCYDYDPPDDAFGPCCRAILRRLGPGRVP